MSSKEQDRQSNIFKNPVTINSLGDFYNLQNRVLGFGSQSEGVVDSNKKVFPQEKILMEGHYKVGGKNINQIKYFLKKNNIKYDNKDVKHMIKNFNYNEMETVHLVVVDVGDICDMTLDTIRKGEDTYEKICKEAENYNFYPIRSDVITVLDLYKELTEYGPPISIAMKPIRNLEGKRSFFWISNRGENQFDLNSCIYPGGGFEPGCMMVFEYRNPQAPTTSAKK